LWGPFFVILAMIFIVDRWEDSRHDWVPVESQPVFDYVPEGAHLVAATHSGWTSASRCSEKSRCEWTRSYASPLGVQELHAQVTRDLERLGFAPRAPSASKCAPAYRTVERWAKGDISVWIWIGPTPYVMGKSNTIPISAGRSVVQLRIDNMEIFWGC
jgi:hypothetical protein